ncbi:hypothetical protein Clacol_008008 [Clathrus columnatus]|uniref:Uncharacterized protein n=1 Tax=Clathrus columnatus TaxID=1419009 RepID=A0AAV5AJ88_9AGAM|nr:hypothetical protein Clacol_008008 [Clathrus columnatus]
MNNGTVSSFSSQTIIFEEYLDVGLISLRTYALCQGYRQMITALSVTSLTALAAEIYASYGVVSAIENIATILFDALAFITVIHQVWGLWRLKKALGMQGNGDFVMLILRQGINLAFLIENLDEVIVISNIGSVNGEEGPTKKAPHRTVNGYGRKIYGFLRLGPSPIGTDTVRKRLLLETKETEGLAVIRYGPLEAVLDRKKYGREAVSTALRHFMNIRGGSKLKSEPHRDIIYLRRDTYFVAPAVRCCFLRLGEPGGFGMDGMFTLPDMLVEMLKKKA